jgi:hypothetical protein
LEAQLADRARAEEVKQRQKIRALGDPELRRSLRQAKSIEREREAQDRAASRSRGIGMERCASRIFDAHAGAKGQRCNNARFEENAARWTRHRHAA